MTHNQFDTEHRNVHPLVRLSPYYYNTEEEIDYNTEEEIDRVRDAIEALVP